jgi:rod shape-determining protein MreD
MGQIIFRNIVLLLILIPIQVFLLDHINIGGSVNPYIYVLFILLLPFETPGWLLLILAFLLGIIIDLFSGTMGMHASATVLMAFLRPFVMRSVSAQRDFESGMKITIFETGFRWFFLYTFILVLVHHIALFFIEVFRLSGFFHTLTMALYSAVFTTLLIIVFQYLFAFRKQK